jgi:hypothetical protein
MMKSGGPDKTIRGPGIPTFTFTLTSPQAADASETTATTTARDVRQKCFIFSSFRVAWLVTGWRIHAPAGSDPEVYLCQDDQRAFSAAKLLVAMQASNNMINGNLIVNMA